MSMPDRSPLLAGELACFTCGSIMKPKVVMGPRGVDHIEYECKGEKDGKLKHDAYRIDSTAMISAEMKPMRIDGTAVKL
jgi:hypothetical protein